MSTLRLLIRLVKYRPWHYLLNALVWLVIQVIPVLPALIIKAILDHFQSNQSLNSGFWWLIVAIAGVYICRVAVVYVGTVTYEIFGFYIDGLLRLNLLKGILKRPGAEALTTSTGEALNRFRDDVVALEAALDWPLDTFGKMFSALFAVVILLRVNAQMTLLVFLPLVVVLMIVQQVRKSVRKYREAGREATSKVIGVMGEIFSSVQAIQVAGAEEPLLRHFQELNQERHKSMLRDKLFVKVLEAGLQNVVHLGTGLILIVSAQSLRNGLFSVGDFALFTSYWFNVAEFTEYVGGTISAYQQASVSHKRLSGLIEGQSDEELVRHEPLYLRGELPELKEGQITGGVGPLRELAVRNLTYHFPDGMGGIDDVSFTVQGGSFTVITGRIGSGKSTLLRVVLGLLPAEGGKVFWNGQAVAEPAEFFVPPRSAYTGQIPHLFSDTVRNNILLGQKDVGQELTEVVHSAVLEQDLAGLEAGLDTVIGPRGVKLSGGQIQRVAAARMFASHAQLYLFDDISSALDVETENLLWNRLFEQPTATCIAVSNRRIALQRADKIIVMKDGQVIAEGRLGELLQTCEEMRLIYGSNSAQSA